MRQRMIGRGDGDQFDLAQPVAFQARLLGRERPGDAQRGFAPQHQIGHGAKGLDPQCQGNRRKLCGEIAQARGEAGGWKHHVDHHGHTRLKARIKRLGPRTQAGERGLDPAQFLNHRRTLRGQSGFTGPLTLEQRHAELRLDIGDGIGNH